MSASHLVTPFPGALFPQAPVKKDIHCRIVAHRGANNEAPNSLLPPLPENTLPALREAYAKGVLYVECDIHLTRDGKIIVFHDDTLARTARYNPDLATTLSPQAFNKLLEQKITALSYEQELSQVDVGSYATYLDKKYRGTKIPLLEEFLYELKAQPQRRLIIELKAEDVMIVKVLRQILSCYKKEYKLDDRQMLIISFDYKLIKFSKSILPEHKHFLLTTNIKGKDDLDNYIRLAKEAGLDGLDVEYDDKLIDADFIQRLKKNKLRSLVWTYPKDDNLEMVEKMLAVGVDLINTNQPEFIFSSLLKTAEKTASLTLSK